MSGDQRDTMVEILRDITDRMKVGGGLAAMALDKGDMDLFRGCIAEVDKLRRQARTITTLLTPDLADAIHKVGTVQ